MTASLSFDIGDLDATAHALLGLSVDDLRLLPDRSAGSAVDLVARRAGLDQALALLDALRDDEEESLSLTDTRARLLLDAGRHSDAVGVSRERLARKESLSARLLLARALLNGGAADEAAEIAAAMLAAEPERVTSLYAAGLVALARHDLSAARGHFERLLQLHEESPTGLRGLARVALAEGDAESALDLAGQALDHYSEAPPDLVRELQLYAARLNGAGQAALAQRRAAEALAAREEALEARDAALRERLAEELVKAHEGKGRCERRASASTRDAADDADDSAAPGQMAALPSAPPPDPSTHDTLLAALRETFGYDAFREGQEQVISAVLGGHDTLAVMPTGAGKSLCYQLPALLREGVTLVISPLIALMKDQVDSLPPALLSQTTLVNSSLESAELNLRLGAIATGRYRLVYAAPERLRQRPFIHALARAGVGLVVIDEAHCLSMWGHDFRPDYLFIRAALPDLGDPQVLAMTATATPAMMNEIASQLGRDLCAVNTGVLRDNLYLMARRAENEDHKLRLLLPFVQRQKGAGIVYVNSRETAEKLERQLRQAGINARAYHAGMGPAERTALQDRFMSGEVRVMVATVAFGMGVDKADVRFIVHFNPARSLEAYSQESGRAGRDGKPAVCLLLHSSADRANLTRWSKEQAVDVEGLRAVYRILRALLRGGEGLVDAGALRERLEDEQQGGVDLRVAISVLENAGLLRRGADVPRGATVTVYPSGLPFASNPGESGQQARIASGPKSLFEDDELFADAPGTTGFQPGSNVPGSAGILPDPGHPHGSADTNGNRLEAGSPGTAPATNSNDHLDAGSDGLWPRFVALSHAQAGRPVTVDLAALAREMGLGVTVLEDHLLTWQDEDLLSYRGIGRDMLIELLPPPPDSAERMAAILDALGRRQRRQLRSLFAYLDTDRCRHALIARHFGHDAEAQCRRCDVCRPVTLDEMQPVAARRVDDPIEAVRQLVGQFPLRYGKSGVAEILKGVTARRLHAGRTDLFGSLAHLSRAAIDRTIDNLLDDGELVMEMHDGYRMLRPRDDGS